MTTVTLTRDETETKCKRYPVKIKIFQDFKNGGSGSITDLTFDLSTDEDQVMITIKISRIDTKKISHKTEPHAQIFYNMLDLKSTAKTESPRFQMNGNI